MSRVAVFGSSGMLGSTLTKVLCADGHEVIELNRSGLATVKTNEIIEFDVQNLSTLEDSLRDRDIEYTINCIGLIKQRFDEKSLKDAESAKLINSQFPLHLHNAALKLGLKLVQIGTDCVYSGAKGNYTENDAFDPIDLYGRSKLKGEQSTLTSMILRTSIIGVEDNSAYSLLSWLLSQPKDFNVNGFTNHLWNGVTTFHFSQIVSGVIKSDYFIPGISHLVPLNVLSKFEILREASKRFGRDDLRIREFETTNPIDRSLSTVEEIRNQTLWALGGYDKIPAIEKMISDYANWCKSELEIS
jgi:dTDP-4-dehydrorhamnose reductase